MTQVSPCGPGTSAGDAHLLHVPRAEVRPGVPVDVLTPAPRARPRVPAIAICRSAALPRASSRSCADRLDFRARSRPSTRPIAAPDAVRPRPGSQQRCSTWCTRTVSRCRPAAPPVDLAAQASSPVSASAAGEQQPGQRYRHRGERRAAPSPSSPNLASARSPSRAPDPSHRQRAAQLLSRSLLSLCRARQRLPGGRRFTCGAACARRGAQHVAHLCFRYPAARDSGLAHPLPVQLPDLLHLLRSAEAAAALASGIRPRPRLRQRLLPPPQVSGSPQRAATCVCLGLQLQQLHRRQPPRRLVPRVPRNVPALHPDHAAAVLLSATPPRAISLSSTQQRQWQLVSILPYPTSVNGIKPFIYFCIARIRYTRQQKPTSYTSYTLFRVLIPRSPHHL